MELLIAGKPSQGDVSRGGGEKQGGAKTAIPRLIPTSPPPCLIQLPKQKNRSKQVETALQQKPTAPIPTPPSSGKKYVFSNVSHQPKNFHDLDIDTLEKDRLGLKWMQFVILFMKHLPD